MTTKDIKRARRLLDDHAERYDIAIEGNGQCLTAHWIGGGQSRFSSIDAVLEWLQEKERRDSRPIIGERIFAARKSAGVSQAELSRRTGLSQAAISDIERSVRADVLVGTAEKIADALGITPGELIAKKPAGGYAAREGGS